MAEITCMQSEAESKTSQTLSVAASVGFQKLTERDARKANFVLFRVEKSQSEDASGKTEGMKMLREICEKVLRCSG